MGLRIRMAVCSLIYRKAVSSNPTNLQKISNGKIITYISKDAYAFDGAVMFINDLWVGAVQIPVLGYFMYLEVGWAGVISICFLLLLIPLQAWLAKNIQRNRFETAGKTDERLKLIQEVLTSIRIIKMYVWEKYFINSINQRRKKEMQKLRNLLYWKTILLGIGSLSIRVSYYICILLYMTFGFQITAQKAFVVLGLYNSLRSVFATCVPMGITQITEARTAATRIQLLLESEEPLKIRDKTNNTKNIDAGIKLEDVSVGFGDNIILSKLNLKLSEGLVGVTGSVGCGKSALLKLFVHKDPKKGSIEINGNISYASQEPWLFPGTIKDNIIFGEKFDPTRYKIVIDICALSADLELFLEGDQTVVIDKGLNLSKGQQARVNLARAIYREADIYLLDDPLSGLDTNVSHHIFEKCIKDFLTEKIVLFVNQSASFLNQTSQIILIKDKTINISTPGTVFDEIMSSTEKTKVDVEVDENKELIQKDGEEDFESELKHLVSKATKDGVYHEDKKDGNVSWDVYKFYLKNGGGFLMIVCVLSVFIGAQVASNGFDYYISVWIKTEQNLTDFEAYTENLGHNSTEYKDLLERRKDIFTNYSLLIFFSAILSMSEAMVLFYFTIKASINIHKIIIKHLIHATMQFFDGHLTGTILNRFSRDTAALDESIPYSIYYCIQTVFGLIAVILIVATASTYGLLLGLAFCVPLILIKIVYMPTGRSLKRLDNSSRSPIVGHMNATLAGLTTIKASDAEDILKRQFDVHQNLHCSASFMYLSTLRGFGFFLEVFNASLAAVFILILIAFRNNFEAGIVGVLITKVFSLTGTLQWGMRMWVDLENTMTSLERIKEYSSVETENSKTRKSIENWPSQGCIKFQDVLLRYNESDQPILRNISFKVEPNEKIGIIGRTGAGKSSMVSTIFNLYKYEGKITIDDMDIKNVSIDLLRAKLSIIPQDPILFSGTVRTNIDPEQKEKDEKIWSILKEINLKHLIKSLDDVIDSGSTSLSSGQKQLFCLGRAISKENRILILDEATSNVDSETDLFIQNIISTKFTNCTMLIIAHRLETIMNCDKVMVLEKGTIIEFDSPSNLLENENGTFSNMVATSGILINRDKNE